MGLPIKCDVSQSTNEVIKELALPASTQIGQALGNVFGLLNTSTLPLKFTNVWAQRNFQKYSEKLNDISQEQIKQVEPEIAIPLIEKLSYTSNEDLANAYANLLANASNKEKVDLIHPGFIQKLNNLCPDEARLLEYLKNHQGDVYYIFFQGENSESGNFRQLSLILTGIEKELDLLPKQMVMHLENLVSLSILKDNAGSYKINEDGYHKLIEIYAQDKQTYEKKITEKIYPTLDKLEIEKSYYSITSLGRIFIEACTSKTKTQ